MNGRTLSSIYDAISDLPPVPHHISSNLKHSLRPYQQTAIRRWLHYMNVDTKTKTLPVELLFNMATGSGKTLIMAALILDLYQRGYRNFIYFVNSTNIIEKTRDNFTNPHSQKYLFADHIIIDNRHVPIRNVTSFASSNPDAINIIFTTIQQLHLDLNNPSENRPSYTELEDLQVALIGDEAHHNNTKTLMSKTDRVGNANWESTVNTIMHTAKDPILLEFTATIDLDDAGIYHKYKDRIIYKYDLKKFREDGYSKDVMIYQVDADLKRRMLQAIIISQYRKKVALRHGIFLKPVVLFKSNKISDNQANFQLFQTLIRTLNAQTLQTEREQAASILREAFDGMKLDLADLAAELKNDFMPERLMIIDGHTITPGKQLQLNSLEDANNEIRAIFAVDMLNEGWDVLNLFDIVRLYDTRDAKNNKPGKTTIREAQLIGRGARYFPFVTDDESQKYLRKYDDNESEELRLIEQLHYHSTENPHYIQELRQALITSGIVPANFVEWTLHLKPSFKQSHIYCDGVIYLNQRQSVTEAQFHQTGEPELPNILEVHLPTNLGKITSAFAENPTEDSSANKTTIKFVYGNVIPRHITRHAMSLNRAFRFANLSKKLAHLPSAEYFMDRMSKIYVIATGINLSRDTLTPAEQLFIAREALRSIENKIAVSDATFIGATEFTPHRISDLFTGVRRKYLINQGPASDPEFGRPQSQTKNAEYRLNLKSKDWYIYDENYSTSADKTFIVIFNQIFNDLAAVWRDIYLLPSVNAVTLYTFDDGRVFTPDYLLLAKDKPIGRHNWQIFVKLSNNSEPWQSDFLAQIATRSHVETADGSHVHLAGLTFPAEPQGYATFISTLKTLAKGNY